MMTLERPLLGTLERRDPAFGIWLAERIERVGLSQRQVAFRAGYTPAFLSRLITGKVGYSDDAVEAIAD